MEREEVLGAEVSYDRLEKIATSKNKFHFLDLIWRSAEHFGAVKSYF
jgi:hypothetical protein